VYVPDDHLIRGMKKAARFNHNDRPAALACGRTQRPSQSDALWLNEKNQENQGNDSLRLSVPSMRRWTTTFERLTNWL
jgi:hypothetical protein